MLYVLDKLKLETRGLEMTQPLRVLIPLAEDLSLICSTHMAANNLLQESNTFF